MSIFDSIPRPLAETIQSHLTFLYGQERGQACSEELATLLAQFRQRRPNVHPARQFNQADSFLITYGDQITEPGHPPLQTLTEFLRQQVRGSITGIHLLPFFPYSSDDGFSIIDYSQVNPDLGSWDDVVQLGQDFDLMFDAVINHISIQSRWFQAFLEGDPAYQESFITVEPGTDLSQVTRPRARPLLSPVETNSGPKLVWTTFSPDQVDLNYAHPQILLRIIEVILYYIEKDASLIRLDAIAYLWKTIGTSCIHLEQTHRVIQLFRVVLDAVAPGVKLITETNVPHQENISYLGDGTDEAQMVYQFSLAPLILHAIQTGRAGKLSRWAAGLSLPSEQVAFFNFTASHDGIGIMPARGILSEGEIQALVDQTIDHGGLVSYKTNPDGSQSVYELNISFFDALSNPRADEAQALQVARFMLSQTIMLAMVGVPGIYVHSLLGSRSWPAGTAQTGHNRTINREKFRRAELEAELADPNSIRHQVFKPYLQLLRKRAAHPAFHPHGQQQVIQDNEALFILLRSSPNGRELMLGIHNVSGREQSYRIRLPEMERDLVDLISGERYGAAQKPELTLQPYQALWLIPTS